MRTLDVIGLDEKKVKGIVDGLSILLADLQVYYSNLRGFHWNVEGHAFFTLHRKYEELYNDTATKVDDVAERILQLGTAPEHRYSEYLKNTEVKEATNVKDNDAVFDNLFATYKTLIARERQIVELASEAGDEATVALMDDYLKSQEKIVWMLVAVRADHYKE